MISWSDVLYVAGVFLVCGIIGLIWACIVARHYSFHLKIRKEEKDVQQD